MQEKYIEQYKLLYEIKPKYGASSVKLFDTIMPIIKEYNPVKVLDYGCGRSPLIDMIKENYEDIIPFRYDPVFEKFSALPNEKMDFVICTDVLQHVPVDDLDNTLLEITNLSKNCFFHIKCTDHPTKFPNGEPSNITVRDKEWWKNYLSKFFDCIEEVFYPDDTTVTFKTK